MLDEFWGFINSINNIINGGNFSNIGLVLLVSSCFFSSIGVFIALNIFNGDSNVFFWDSKCFNGIISQFSVGVNLVGVVSNFLF